MRELKVLKFGVYRKSEIDNQPDWLIGAFLWLSDAQNLADSYNNSIGENRYYVQYISYEN